MPQVGIYASNEVNAFATGPAGNTLIAFSTNLVNHMSMEEIRGVVGHELSHLIHYDLRRILLVQGIFDVLYWIFSALLFWLIFSSAARRRNEDDGVGDFVRLFLGMILFQIITGIFRLIGMLFVLWYNRKRELAADLRGAKIVGVNDMLATLRKLSALEKKN
jgi:heat shock protein HtpX